MCDLIHKAHQMGHITEVIQHSSEEHGLCNQGACIYVLSCPFLSVTLCGGYGQSHTFCEPQFSHLYNEASIGIYLTGLYELI